jgi:hypothetical protein
MTELRWEYRHRVMGHGWEGRGCGGVFESQGDDGGELLAGPLGEGGEDAGGLGKEAAGHFGERGADDGRVGEPVILAGCEEEGEGFLPVGGDVGGGEGSVAGESAASEHGGDLDGEQEAEVVDEVVACWGEDGSAAEGEDELAELGLGVAKGSEVGVEGAEGDEESSGPKRNTRNTSFV